MAENTGIEWATHTFNGWAGCEKVSEGCQFCYAERDQERFRFVPWGPKATRRRTSAAYWRKPLQWDQEQARREAEAAEADLPRPLRPRVFAFSWGDVFEQPASATNRANLAAWLGDFHALVDATPHLIWLVLTKRAEAMARYYMDVLGRVPANVMPGISAENQARYDERLPWALRLAAPFFVSAEPLLGRLTLGLYRTIGRGISENHQVVWQALRWVILGGESGPNARPLYASTARAIQLECELAGVPFLFKQWGEWAPASAVSVPDRAPMILGPDGVPVFNVGRKAAGRELDGRTWDEIPQEFHL